MSEKPGSKNWGAFWAGLSLGAAAGAVTGLLVAPRQGRETRRLIRKSADALPELVEDLAGTLQLQADRLSHQAAGRWEGTLGRLREAIAAGIEASRAIDAEGDWDPAAPDDSPEGAPVAAPRPAANGSTPARSPRSSPPPRRDDSAPAETFGDR